MPLRVSFALSLAVLAACGEPRTGDVALGGEPVALFPDDPGRLRLEALSYRGGLALSAETDAFGGWSAMEIEGERLLAVSDRGSWMTARLDLDDEGALVGLFDVVIAPMLDPDGAPLQGEARDAEGLAPLGGGRYAVSFERDHRIWVYDLGADWRAIGEARPSGWPTPPGAERLRANAGVEALARTTQGLWVGIEYPAQDDRPHTLWRYDPTDLAADPSAFALAVESGFGLTGLAADGEDGLIVLERFWSRDVGNRIRIGRLSAEVLSTASGDAPLRPEILAAFEPDMTVDNFEAAAVVEIDGETRLFLLSDDNFNASQRTLLMSFALERKEAE